MNQRNMLFAFLASSALIAGCGGGGSTTDSGDSTDADSAYGSLNEGILLDGATNGLNVEYPTGETAVVANGLIGYYDNAPSTLSLGGSEIASVDGNRIVPFEGLEVDSPSADYWTNVGFLLLTADSDGNPGNGIEIGSDTRSVADGYALSFSVDSATFVTNNDTALEAIRATTSRSALPTVGEAEAWVSEIRSTLADAFSTPSYLNFAMFSEGTGFEGTAELYEDATGLLRVSNTGAFGDNISTNDGQVDITNWSTVNDSQYPAGLTGVEFTTEFQTVTCYPLKRNRMSYDAYCFDGDTIDSRYVLGDYIYPINEFYALETELNLGNLGVSDLSLYGGRGSTLAGTSSDNTLQGEFVFEIGGGSYVGQGAGSWVGTGDALNGRRFIEDDTGTGIDVGVVGQIGLGAFEINVTPIEEDGAGDYNVTGDSEYSVAVVSGLNLVNKMIAGKTFKRYNTSTFDEIGDITLQSGGSTSQTGVTWEITNSGNGLSLTGAQFDRCTFAGEVVGDLFFYCDTSFESGVGRFEHWVISTNLQ